MQYPLKFAVLAATPLLLAACANKDKEEMMMSYTSRAQQTADQAQATAREALATANAAKAEAERALQAAQDASQKADMMYQRGLRK